MKKITRKNKACEDKQVFDPLPGPHGNDDVFQLRYHPKPPLLSESLFLGEKHFKNQRNFNGFRAFKLSVRYPIKHLKLT